MAFLKTNIMPWEQCKLLYIFIVRSILLLSIIPAMDVPVCLTIHLLKHVFVVSRFWLLQIKHAHVLGGEDKSFCFSGINALKCHCWILWYVYVFFCRKRPNYFPEWVYYVTVSSAISERPSISASWSAFCVVLCKILVLLVVVLC